MGRGGRIEGWTVRIGEIIIGLLRGFQAASTGWKVKRNSSAATVGVFLHRCAQLLAKQADELTAEAGACDESRLADPLVGDLQDLVSKYKEL